MKELVLCLALLCTCFASASASEVPEDIQGTWVAKNYLPADGGYGEYYQSWLFIGSDAVDEILTLGAHFTKIKYKILAAAEGQLSVQDSSETDAPVFTLNYFKKDLQLEVCRRNHCNSYSRSDEAPQTEEPVAHHPAIEVSALWCVDEDCQTEVYLPLVGEQIINLSTDLRAKGGYFAAPEELQKKHGIVLSLASVAYRFENETSELNSFSALFHFTGASKMTGENLFQQSAVLRLHEGLLTELSGQVGGQRVSVSLYIRRLN
ncbi:hypothetical protein EZJ49_07485 [Bdellovibrio bacteriovorus]|uniref:hypothetical protein n=1 Tax=Bdellovibrio bacteriovorus TaxID=959 RepID=UPI0021D0D61C|nr:hypothetical protein [Bdellovibrio bacteriovorus]UXR66090.1 hypothetical protein EZJ49_07485 [Bdellovibrio bacteriovorus]